MAKMDKELYKLRLAIDNNIHKIRIKKKISLKDLFHIPGLLVTILDYC